MLRSLNFAEISSGIHIYQFTFNLYTSVFGCGCGFGFEQKFWQIDRFDEKRHGSADLHTPIHPPPYSSNGKVLPTCENQLP